MSSHITVREIAERGITVTADETGTVYVNGIPTTTPITAGGITFVWAPKELKAPPHTQIGLSPEQVAKINAHAASYLAACREHARKAKAHDDLYNEGGDGYNPYR